MENIKLFYATSNKSKLHNMRFRLREYPITVLCPDDLNIHIEVNENGVTAVENALHKATEYYKKVQLPTIAGDSGVVLTGVAEEDQPGLFVRRVNGKVLTDDEMIDHYAGLARKSVNHCTLQYVTGIALITSDGVKTMELLDRPLQLCAEPNPNRKHKGNPLDVVTKTVEGIYFNALSDDERTAYDQQGEQQFTQFVVNNLLKCVSTEEKVISALAQRGKTIGFDYVSVGEIYDWNTPYRRSFESAGFQAYEKTKSRPPA